MGRIADALRRAARQAEAESVPEPPAENPAPQVSTPDLARLAAVVDTLHNSTGELGRAIDRIESALNSLHAEVEVWLDDRPVLMKELGVDQQVNERVFEFQELGYGHLDEGWGLGIRTVHKRETDERRFVVAQRALRRSGREEQLASGELIPQLVERMTERVSHTIARIEQVTRTAASLTRGSQPAASGRTDSWEIL